MSDRKRVGMVSLGCPKNLVDSERMLGLLNLAGYKLVSEPQGADFVIVNTCGFLESAREESIERRAESIDKREHQLSSQAGQIAKREKDLEDAIAEEKSRLESLAGMSSDQAKAVLLERVKQDVSHDAAVIIRETEQRVQRQRAAVPTVVRSLLLPARQEGRCASQLGLAAFGIPEP